MTHVTKQGERLGTVGNNWERLPISGMCRNTVSELDLSCRIVTVLPCLESSSDEILLMITCWFEFYKKENFLWRNFFSSNHHVNQVSRHNKREAVDRPVWGGVGGDSGKYRRLVARAGGAEWDGEVRRVAGYMP